ncbi:MarR family transcriptional regulator [Paenibacillus sp.]|uniref:MarR family winged helix-turn-helix transcriptional regulator n=1 Tax=Paenibacillus sp. TaxID=58172 RepID=UPI002D6B0E16|nr:MarR family transcriptional regulator [Paenibacillus sp.]HZG58257.1 MarR family transcriptional regulator [Paenibacillus sp.]
MNTDANVDELLASLQALNRHLRSSAFDEGQPLTKVQWLLLRRLQRQGTATIGQLAAHLDVRASTMSQMLDRLERSGFVARTQDAADARVKLVTLTEAGRATIGRTENVWRNALSEPFRRLTAEERETLTQLMKKLSEQLPGRGET